MKTMIRKLKKSGVERLAALLLLILTGFTFSAWGTVIHINDSNTIDVVYRDLRTVEAPFSTATGNLMIFENFGETLKLETESKLVLENWMTEIEFFSISTHVIEIEEHLEIENWMISSPLFSPVGTEPLEKLPVEVKTGKKQSTIDILIPGTKNDLINSKIEEPEENELELEKWMCNKEIWKNRN